MAARWETGHERRSQPDATGDDGGSGTILLVEDEVFVPE
jgi:hypothetical protein